MTDSNCKKLVHHSVRIETREQLDALPDWSIISWGEHGERVGRTQKNSISSLDGGDIVLDKDEVLPFFLLWRGGK